jgi:hypothetical protein
MTTSVSSWALSNLEMRLLTGDNSDEAFANEQHAHSNFVRRPMRGIVVPKDTHASLFIEDNNAVLTNTSLQPGVSSNITHNFILQNVTESRSEKSQFITTFGSTYAFFFGEQPRLISCSAILPNSADFEWHKEWWANYSNMLRGTSLTSRNQVAVLSYGGDGRDRTFIRGFLTNCTSMISAQDPYVIQISFSMFVESMTRTPASKKAPRRTGSTADTLDVGALTDPSDALLLPESSTAAVRRLNIKLSPFKQEPGVLGKISSALNSLDAAIDNTIRQARNFLYGRNLVVPVNFTASRPESNPIFTEGSGTEGLEGLTVTNFFGKGVLAFAEGGPQRGLKTVNLRTKTDGQYSGVQDFRISKNQREKSEYYAENFDEYIGVDLKKARDLVEGVEDLFRSPYSIQLNYSTQSIAAFAAFGIKVTPFGVVDRDDRASLERAANTYYWAEYSKQKTAEALRIVGRAAFGVATFAIGTSVVNNRRRLQENITNPNSGNLARNERRALQGDIAQAQRSAEQRRLVQDRKAAELRGETGVVYPGTLGAILSVIL